MHPAACPTCCMRRVSFFCPVAPPQFTPPQPAPHLAPIIASVPVGRQCHHSAASSSARLNTGPKVQTAARAGRCALTDTCKNTHAKRKKRKRKKTDYITHTHLLPFAQNLSVSLAYSCTYTDKSPAAKLWQRARDLICMGQSWYLDGGSLGRPTQISLTLRLTHSGLVFFPVLFTDLSTRPLSFLNSISASVKSYMQHLGVMKCTVGMWMQHMLSVKYLWAVLHSVQQHCAIALALERKCEMNCKRKPKVLLRKYTNSDCVCKRKCNQIHVLNVSKV